MDSINHYAGTIRKLETQILKTKKKILAVQPWALSNGHTVCLVENELRVCLKTHMWSELGLRCCRSRP